jgi:hypothetical protein
MFKKFFSFLNALKIKRLERELEGLEGGMLRANIEFEIRMLKNK